MKKSLTITLILGLFIFMLTGCIVRNHSSAHNTITEGSKITDTYSYTVEDDFKGMKLEINLALTKGKVKFELKDPNGDVQWSEEVTADKSFKELKNFDKIVGNWTLTFESIDNSGEGKYELQFNRL